MIRLYWKSLQMDPLWHKETFPKLLFGAVALLLYIPALYVFYRFSLPSSSGVLFPALFGDSSEYITLGQNLLSYGVFSMDSHPPFQPEYFRTPGYPMFILPIILIFQSLYAVSFVQIILATGTSLLIFKMGERLLGTWAGLAAGLLYLVNPSTLFYSLTVMSDVLFTFLIVLSVYLLLFRTAATHSFPVLVSGVLLGLATLVRPVGVFLPVVFIVGYFFLQRNTAGTRQKLYHMGIFVAAFCLVLAPWIIRNRLGSGVWGLSSVGNYNLFYYNVPLFLTYKTGHGLRQSLEMLKMDAPVLSEREEKELGNSEMLKKVAGTYIRQDPFGYLTFHLSRLPQFFGGNSSKNLYVNVVEILLRKENPFADNSLLIDDVMQKRDMRLLWKRLRAQGLFPIEYIVWLLLLLLWLLSVLSPTHRRYTLFFMSIVLYFGILTGPVVHVRYRLPAEPFIFLSATLGFRILRDFSQNSRKLTCEPITVEVMPYKGL